MEQRDGELIKQEQVSREAFLQQYAERLAAATQRAQHEAESDALRRQQMASTERARARTLHASHHSPA